jgi:hypothetical protein
VAHRHDRAGKHDRADSDRAGRAAGLAGLAGLGLTRLTGMLAVSGRDANPARRAGQLSKPGLKALAPPVPPLIGSPI